MRSESITGLSPSAPPRQATRCCWFGEGPHGGAGNTPCKAWSSPCLHVYLVSALRWVIFLLGMTKHRTQVRNRRHSHWIAVCIPAYCKVLCVMDTVVSTVAVGYKVWMTRSMISYCYILTRGAACCGPAHVAWRAGCMHQACMAVHSAQWCMSVVTGSCLGSIKLGVGRFIRASILGPLRSIHNPHQ